MKKYVSSLCLVFLLLISYTGKTYAISDPLHVPNNRIGVHILFPTEVDKAADLINSSGGDWGYITIPIQAGDRDLEKWQAFMDTCKKRHVIPLIRLATEGDYFNTAVWRKPNDNDITDFANFLDSLTWPTKNRYIIVFNEVNRGDEWGGTPDPTDYAQLLSFASLTFKQRSDDFFIISSGLDNAAATTPIAINQYAFLRQMNDAVPGIFTQIDGLGSHSYPNPAFSSPPDANTLMSISSFKYERLLVQQISQKTLPVFITETGWTRLPLSDDTIVSYYQTAFSSVWNDPGIVVVTPFLLQANGSQFTNFSLIDANNNQTPEYTVIHSLQKTQGKPLLHEEILGTKVLAVQPHITIDFTTSEHEKSSSAVLDSHTVAHFFKWLLRVDQS